MSEQLTNIPFNIWDDYDEDEAPETYGYVEEYDVLTKDQKTGFLIMLHNHLIELKVQCELDLNDLQINFTDLNHEQRDILVRQLQHLKLTYKDLPVHFYSES